MLHSSVAPHSCAFLSGPATIFARDLGLDGDDPPERVGDRFVVDAAEHRLEAAVDGEPDVLETPVEFRIEPRALRVVVPATESGGQD
jgi:hypothetical protein